MNWQPVLAGIVPSIAVGLIFWFAMRAILRADRNERSALAAAEAAHDAEQADKAATAKPIDGSLGRTDAS